MTENTAAILLGIVQGLTEFLPVSSSGHLILVSALLGLDSPSLPTFEVVIQLGSILAVLVLYRRRFLSLVNFSSQAPFSGFRGLWLLFLTCLPASLLGLFCHSFIKAHLFKPLPVAAALAVGALFILYAERRKDNSPLPEKAASIDDISPTLALGVGCFQCLALWPGFSRSTATIMGGLLLGAGRKAAAEYSFIAAVPIMFGAAFLSLLSDLSKIGANDIPFFALGTAMSFIFALLAIKVLVSLISRMSFRPFAWYRLFLAPLVLWFWM
ncbi:undecaprenyl-diphosphate phosphatase [Desulfovibrio sp. OttesenSCG-928-M16]|nr:undecaprenyl-diphosphate phosphatase [Desulfovibrio sp. OttesenSCG-928-M16]